MRPHGRQWLVTGVFALAIVCQPAPLTAQRVSSADVKAAFLFNFTKFATWPATRLPAGQPIIVGVIGDNAVAESVRRLVGNKIVEGRSVTVTRLRPTDDFSQTHLLFIGNGERQHLVDILIRAGRDAVLTVSDVPDFCARGGMIQLRNERDRVRFDIALDRAEAAGLIISSRLLAIAGVINPASSVRFR